MDGRLGCADGLVDAVRGGLVGARVSDTNREAVVQEPKVDDDALHSREEALANDGTEIYLLEFLRNANFCYCTPS